VSQITTIDWLRLPGQYDTTKLSKFEFEKRKEVFLEFVYWLFDSLLIPLLRSNFHVTESNAHRHRLFYFRHDVWRMLTEPALATLKRQMFEEMPMECTTNLLSARQLGFSNVRLLPKKVGFRTIMNLKRRQQILRNGAMSLGRSINTVMTPVFNAINYEKVSEVGRYHVLYVLLISSRRCNLESSVALSFPWGTYPLDSQYSRMLCERKA